jgi:hypothetical protein
MKGIIMPSNVQLHDETKKELTHEVKETVASEAINSKDETFTASQMWNHHRRMSSASDRMRRWNLN